jgi:hypothetical protein
MQETFHNGVVTWDRNGNVVARKASSEVMARRQWAVEQALRIGDGGMYCASDLVEAAGVLLAFVEHDA